MAKKIIRRKVQETKPPAPKRAKKEPEKEASPLKKRPSRAPKELAEAVAETLTRQAKSKPVSKAEKVLKITAPPKENKGAVKLSIMSEGITVKKVTKLRQEAIQDMFYGKAYDYDIVAISAEVKDFLIEFTFANRFKTPALFNGDFMSHLVEGVASAFRISQANFKLTAEIIK